MRIGNHDTCWAADIFPFLSAEKFKLLAASIKKNGLLEPILLLPDGLILNGRNRYQACIEVGVEPRFATYEGRVDEEGLFVYAEGQLVARQMSPIEIIAASEKLGARRAIKQERKRNRSQPTLPAVPMVTDAEQARIDEDACPELKAAVASGAVAKETAVALCTLEDDEQRKGLERIAKGTQQHKAITPGDQWLPPQGEHLTRIAICVRCNAVVIEHRHGIRCARCGPLIQWRGK